MGIALFFTSNLKERALKRILRMKLSWDEHLCSGVIKAKDTCVILNTPCLIPAWEKDCTEASQFLSVSGLPEGQCDLRGELRKRPWRFLKNMEGIINQPKRSPFSIDGGFVRNLRNIPSQLTYAELQDYDSSSQQCQSNKNFLVLFTSFHTWPSTTKSWHHLLYQIQFLPCIPLIPHSRS